MAVIKNTKHDSEQKVAKRPITRLKKAQKLGQKEGKKERKTRAY